MNTNRKPLPQLLALQSVLAEAGDPSGSARVVLVVLCVLRDCYVITTRLPLDRYLITKRFLLSIRTTYFLK